MLKRILLATDGSQCAPSVVSHAVALAKCFKATVVGLSVIDVKLLTGPFLHDVGASVGFGDLDAYQPRVHQMLVDKANAALELAAQACEADGVGFEPVMTEGRVPAEIVEKAKFADIIVMGKQGEHAQFSEGELGSTVESVVRRSSRPVLLAPPAYSPIRRALAAYDGSSYAYDALRALVGMAQGMKLDIYLLTVAETGEHAADILDRAESYVRDCGIEVESNAMKGHPEEVIAKTAQAWNADLIAMGAYGHSRIREFIVGSTTESVMRQSNCAFLLYR